MNKKKGESQKKTKKGGRKKDEIGLKFWGKRERER